MGIQRPSLPCSSISEKMKGRYPRTVRTRVPITKRLNCQIPHTGAVTSQTFTYCFLSTRHFKPKGERVAPSRKRFQTLESVSKVLCQSGVTGNVLTVATLRLLQPLPTVFTLSRLSPNPDTSCECFPWNTERVLSGATCGINLSFSAMATRNPLTLKIKRGVV